MMTKRQDLRQKIFTVYNDLKRSSLLGHFLIVNLRRVRRRLKVTLKTKTQLLRGETNALEAIAVVRHRMMVYLFVF